MAEYWESLQNLFHAHIETDQLQLEVDSTTLCSVLLSLSGFIGLIALGITVNKKWKQCKAAKEAQPKEVQPKLVSFSHNWTISNFLACDLISNAEYIDSAEFAPPGCPKERFQLRIHPRAGKDGQDVSLFLRYVPTPEVVAPPPATEGENPPAESAAPVEKLARIQFVCRIVQPKELKADIKSGQNVGWSNFITRGELLNHLDGGRKSKLHVFFQGHIVVNK